MELHYHILLVQLLNKRLNTFVIVDLLSHSGHCFNSILFVLTYFRVVSLCILAMKKSKQNEFFHMENITRIINQWRHDNKGRDQLSEQKRGSWFRPLFKRN